MCVDYDGGCEFIQEKMVKARKEHRCCECHRTIQPGESYEKTVGNWEGAFSVFKTCAHCVAAREWIMDTCGGFMYCGLDEELKEHLDEYSWCWQKMNLGFVARGLVGLRRGWKKFKGNGLMTPLNLETYKKPTVPVGVS